MKRRILCVVIIILFVVGLGFLIFPTVSNNIGKEIAKAEVLQFEEQIKEENTIKEKDYHEALENGEIDDKGYPINENGQRTSNVPLLFEPDLDRLYADSVDYNEMLKISQSTLLVDSYAYTNPSIDLTSYGIYNGFYGYISAPTINMKLPIYLGANDNTMSYGAAHLTYTSLPLGGNSTNTVLAGHTGYIGRIFFDNLRKLQIGDEIEIKNYWSTLEYKVIKTEIHKPNDVNNIYISDGQDLLTLITCISDGKGSFDRLYVICKRI